MNPARRPAAHGRTQRLRSAILATIATTSLVACGADGPSLAATDAPPATTRELNAVEGPAIPRVGDRAVALPSVADSSDQVPVVAPTSTTPAPVPLVTIPDVGFDLDTAALTPAATDLLSRNLDQMRNAAGIEIDGHTDSTGTAQHNQALSEARAGAVAAWLAAHEVSPERITTRGFGSERPIATNDDPDGRATNRRVEILSRA